ncbi:MAG: hypothetical protein KDH16_21765, partial [Rhodocyclaceae bacterium]|nr:hypothetical protein [Rhodocyclaceae bacterium]
DALNGIYIEETSGNLRVHHVYSTTGDVTLTTRAGSIVDAQDDTDSGGAALFFDADGRARDAINVRGMNIDLDANGGSIGVVGDDLDIDSGVVNGSHTAGQGRLFAEASQNIYLTEVNGELNVLAATALGGALRLTIPDTSAIDTEDLNLLDIGAGATARVSEDGARSVTVSEITALSTVALWVGDNVKTFSANRILAGTSITLRGDQRRDGKTDNVSSDEADAGRGTRMLLKGTIGKTGAPADITVANNTAKTFTRIFGHDDVDTFRFVQTDLDANTSVYGSAFVTPAGGLQADDANDGEDRFIVDRLGSMHVGLDGKGDTLTLDGQSDTDTYTIYTTGSEGAANHYVINVLDTGAKIDGVDTLAVFGVDDDAQGNGGDDIFLLRRTSYIPDEAAEASAFVAVLHGDLNDARAGLGSTVQRINYDANLNGRLEVYGLSGDDTFAMDDNSAITTLDGGKGNDTFQIGQLYGSQRQPANVQAPDAFDTIATTRGYVSRGATMAVVAQGGEGNDVFTVYSNKAELRLEGDAGDDLFVVRAFALAKVDANGNILTDANGVAQPLLTSDVSTQGQTKVKTGEGEDTVQYNINAPVSVDGGAGFDKVVILGTEFPDNFVITKDGVYGAGINVRFENVEVLEVDGLEGDDNFYVLSTPVGVITRVIGGLGSDTIDVAGDVTEPIVMQQLEGASGSLSHSITGGDGGDYNANLQIDGIDLTVAQAVLGAVVIDESGGSTVVEEGATSDPLAVDSYTVKLAVAPAAGTTVYVTVSAARSQRDEQDAGGDSLWLSSTYPSSFTHDVTVDGATGPVADRALVLAFDASNWDTAQTVYVYGVDDNLAEGERTVAISHSVSAVVDAAGDAAAQAATLATFDQAKVRNVEVTVIDDDAAGLVITETGGNTTVLEGSLTPDANGYTQGIADSYNVKLAKALTGAETVTVSIAFDANQLALSGSGVSVSGNTATITFTAANWNTGVNIGVRAVDDAIREDAKFSFMDLSASGSGYDGVTSQLAVKVYDNDNPGVIIQQSDGGTHVVLDDPNTVGDQSVSDSYTVRLTSAPIANVTITIDTDGQTTTAPTTLTFTTANWYIPQTVTVSANSAYDPDSSSIDTTTQKIFAPRPHLLSELGGPLSVVGGSLGERNLVQAVLLPGEKNAPLLEIGPQPDERDQIDTLNIYDDSSREDKSGVLSATGLTGFNMAPGISFDHTAHGEPSTFPGGISFGDAATGKSSIEVLNFMMGQGNDSLLITGTLQAADEGTGVNKGPARHGTITIVHGGGNLPVSATDATIGGDHITVTGGGGANSPLVIYGDTSQDGLWYSGDPNKSYSIEPGVSPRADELRTGPKLFDQVGTADDDFRFPRANPFDHAGNDVIDASALFVGADPNTTVLGIAIYGGGGNDTIYGTQAADHLAGGSGDDTIY